MRTDAQTDLFRKLPSVDELAHATNLAALVAQEGQTAVTDAVRSVLAALREQIASGRMDANGVELALSGLEGAIERQLRQSLRYSLRFVINATGVILHTNLGRAPLSASALQHIREIAAGYSNLEFDVDSGARGQRDVHVDRLFSKLVNDQVGTAVHGDAGKQASPTISTIVVNNNAAAVLLALNTLADGGEVIVSRGELVEIGGSFRIPDVMAKSNAIL